MVTLLNTSILTAYGSYEYKEISLKTVKNVIKCSGFRSAIGHESTAEILTELLEVDIPVNRFAYRQEVMDVAIVFKLNGRAPEGVILTKEMIEEMGYTFGYLIRTE
jgi:hypothetical protein